MIAVVQRVNKSDLKVDRKNFSNINYGFLVLLGIEKNDEEKDIEYIVRKIVNLRIFEDEKEKMNLSIKDVNGEIMLVSQFTLCADTKKGNRPSFINAEDPDIANKKYEKIIQLIRNEGISVKTGVFGSNMDICLENHGPVTIILNSRA